MKLLIAMVFLFSALQAQGDLQFIKLLDFAQVANVSQMDCMIKSGYEIWWVRAYRPDGIGMFDNSSVTNYMNLKTYDSMRAMHLNFYMSPSPKSSKQGYQQFDEMYFGLFNYNIVIKTIYLQVINPEMWMTDSSANINFINSTIQRANQYGIYPYILTNKDNWMTITGGWAPSGFFATLWWLDVMSEGVSGETQQNFDDWMPFPPWNGEFDVDIKTYAKNEMLCGIHVNKSIEQYRFVPPTTTMLPRVRRNVRIPDVPQFLPLNSKRSHS